MSRGRLFSWAWRRPLPGTWPCNNPAAVPFPRSAPPDRPSQAVLQAEKVVQCGHFSRNHRFRTESLYQSGLRAGNARQKGFFIMIATSLSIAGLQSR